MASKLCYSATFTIMLLIFLSTFSFHGTSAANSPSSNSICNLTPYPALCRSSLPNNNTATVYDYARSSVRNSLFSAQKFQFLIEKYLRDSTNLPTGAIRALEDCRLLAGLNMDYLTTSFRTVNKTQTLSTSVADDIQTLLSAILTNTQTCREGLEEIASSWISSKNDISTPLTNDTRLYSVSLALFDQGWVHKKKRAPSHPLRRLLGLRNGRLPLKMSDKNKAIFETTGHRKLLQSGNNQIVVNKMVTVSQDGTGNFTTINDAVAAAPNNSVADKGYFMIYVTSGVYEEYVVIAKNKKYLMMVGDGINQTVITGDHSVNDGWSTFNSSTLAVVGQGFVGINMTIRNTAGAIKHQAVALRNSADLSTFYSCSFEGYQDTLYVHSLRQFYRECDIFGTVDFIFGNAAVVLQNCNIYPRLPLAKQFNAITAQGRTDPNQNTGISIQNCNITPADDLASSNGTTQTYLGRPWKEYSRTIYMQSFMDSFINPAGWREWSGDFALNTSYYAEFSNTGPGSNTSRRVTWTGFHIIDATDASNFTVSNFILGDDWIPQTGTPYSSNL
ncbi:putative pectinesterase/pectinesterase inhibitor 41 [Apium graveolens]|uniref:putative pectinesterase/pectinesterase inhibitor 41 n=1 Tax=Apium graveolens TaxID=4045 RepID=UPI003D7B01D3